MLRPLVILYLSAIIVLASPRAANAGTLEEGPINLGDISPSCQAIENNYKQAVIDAIQAAEASLQVPVHAGKEGTVVVSFDVLNGSISKLHMDMASGIPAYDDAALKAVKDASLPSLPPQLRDFMLHMSMPVSFYSDSAEEKYVRLIESAVNAAKIYPRTEFYPERATSVVSFDVQNGSAGPVHLDVSSGFRSIDKSAIDAVQNAAIPPLPLELRDRKIHIVMPLDFSLDKMDGGYDLEVFYAVQDVSPNPVVIARPDEFSVVDLSFNMLNGSVIDMHVDRSSENPTIDETAMEDVRRAKLPELPARLHDCKIHVEMEQFFKKE